MVFMETNSAFSTAQCYLDPPSETKRAKALLAKTLEMVACCVYLRYLWCLEGSTWLFLGVFYPLTLNLMSLTLTKVNGISHADWAHWVLVHLSICNCEKNADLNQNYGQIRVIFDNLTTFKVAMETIAIWPPATWVHIWKQVGQSPSLQKSLEMVRFLGLM